MFVMMLDRRVIDLGSYFSKEKYAHKPEAEGTRGMSVHASEEAAQRLYHLMSTGAALNDGADPIRAKLGAALPKMAAAFREATGHPWPITRAFVAVLPADGSLNMDAEIELYVEVDVKELDPVLAYPGATEVSSS